MAEVGDLVPVPDQLTKHDPSGMTGWAKTAVAGGIFSFFCLVVWWVLHAMDAHQARTVDTLQKMHDQQREDRRDERDEARAAMSRAWDTMHKIRESVDKIRESVDKNTTAMNDLTQTLRLMPR